MLQPLLSRFTPVEDEVLGQHPVEDCLRRFACRVASTQVPADEVPELTRHDEVGPVLPAGAADRPVDALIAVTPPLGAHSKARCSQPAAEFYVPVDPDVTSRRMPVIQAEPPEESLRPVVRTGNGNLPSGLQDPEELPHSPLVVEDVLED